MSDQGQYQSALGRLREALVTFRPGNKVYDEVVAYRDQVLARYQSAFAPEHLDALTADEFKTFLYLENNHHWNGLYRKGWRACQDMPALRAALQLLLDESRPIAPRLEQVIDEVPGMGKALATAILLVMFPDRYGVWNNTSEGALRELDIWPTFQRASFGQKYVQVNQLLLNLARDLGLDLWTLDALWWAFLGDGPVPPLPPVPPEPGVTEPSPLAAQRFALERHLQDFLLDNWDRTELGHEWAIYGEEGDDDAGYEYPTDLGRIDLLAKHRKEPRWLVVELKRDQTSDVTVGQVLRYMGWVKRNVAAEGDRVEGLIIAHKADDAISYATSAVSDVNLMLYEVQFHLAQAPRLRGIAQ